MSEHWRKVHLAQVTPDLAFYGVSLHHEPCRMYFIHKHCFSKMHNAFQTCTMYILNMHNEWNINNTYLTMLWNLNITYYKRYER